MTKWVKLPVTVHARDDKKSIPFEYDSNGAVLRGKHVVIIYPPMTPVPLDDDEADVLLKRYADDGAEEVEAPGKAAKAAKPAPPAASTAAPGDNGSNAGAPAA